MYIRNTLEVKSNSPSYIQMISQSVSQSIRRSLAVASGTTLVHELSLFGCASMPTSVWRRARGGVDDKVGFEGGESDVHWFKKAARLGFGLVDVFLI